MKMMYAGGPGARENKSPEHWSMHGEQENAITIPLTLQTRWIYNIYRTPQTTYISMHFKSGFDRGNPSLFGITNHPITDGLTTQ